MCSTCQVVQRFRCGEKKIVVHARDLLCKKCYAVQYVKSHAKSIGLYVGMYANRNKERMQLQIEYIVHAV